MGPSPDFYCPVCDTCDFEEHLEYCCPHPTTRGGQPYICTPLRNVGGISVFARDLHERRYHVAWRSPYPFYRVWLENPSGPWCAPAPPGKCRMNRYIRQNRCRRTTPQKPPQCATGDLDA